MKLTCHKDVVKISERIKKILHDKHNKRNTVIENDNFPRMLEKDVESFMMQYSLNHSALDDSNENSNNDDSMVSPKRCYSVKEVNSENEEEHSDYEDLEEVHDLSSDRLNKADEVADTMFNPKQGSIIIDEDGEKFLDCLSDEEEVSMIQTATPASKENEGEDKVQKES